jgi:hypothetical protein
MEGALMLYTKRWLSEQELDRARGMRRCVVSEDKLPHLLLEHQTRAHKVRRVETYPTHPIERSSGLRGCSIWLPCLAIISQIHVKIYFGIVSACSVTTDLPINLHGLIDLCM